MDETQSKTDADCKDKCDGGPCPPPRREFAFEAFDKAGDAVAAAIKKFKDAGVGGAEGGKLALQLFGFVSGSARMFFND